MNTEFQQPARAQEIEIKNALYHHGRAMPLNWDLNPYRGCGIRCSYCFARYSHRYLGSDNFFGDLMVKSNIADALHRQLEKASWKGEPIKIGGVTDPYQPIEERYRLMPQVLSVLTRHKNPVLIGTKSDLILRDSQQIAELATKTDVAVAVTITTMERDIQRRLEQGAPSTTSRLRLLASLKELGCTTIALAIPIIPYLTDAREQLDQLFEAFRQHHVDSVLAYPLHLRGSTKKHFLHFLNKNYPEIAPKVAALYPRGSLTSSYNATLSEKIDVLKEAHRLNRVYRPNLYPNRDRQLTLFS